MYLIYVNDMDLLSCSLKGDIFLYADDTVYLNYAMSGNELIRNANKDLEVIKNYFNDNKLNINCKKTKVMVFCSNRKEYVIDESFRLDGVNLLVEDSVKYLGIILDKHLTFSEHTKAIALKISPYISVLYKLRYSLNKASLLKIYYAFIHSQLNYLNIVYASGYYNSIAIVEVLQRKALKIIFHKPKLYPTIQLFLDTNILSVTDMHKFNVLMFIHKKRLGLVHTSLSLKYPSHNFNTRQVNMLVKPVSKTNYGIFALYSNGIDLYNKLPADVKSIQIISNFKKSISLLIRSRNI